MNQSPSSEERHISGLRTVQVPQLDADIQNFIVGRRKWSQVSRWIGTAESPQQAETIADYIALKVKNRLLNRP